MTVEALKEGGWHWTAEVALAAYFASSVLYYIRPLPLGHLTNAAFLLVFCWLILVRPRSLVIRRSDAALLILLVVIGCTSLVAWLIRDDWDAGGLVRTLTWLTPAALVVLMASDDSISCARIGKLAGLVGMVINLVFTLMFARFNPEIGKFEVDVAWAGISSNELSFHLVVFCGLFLLLGDGSRARMSGVLAVLLSLIHLSKAHLAAGLLAPVAALCRRRLWLVAAVSLVAILVLRWVADWDGLADLSIGQEFKRVVEPLLGMVVLLAGLVVSGDGAAIGDLASAVGLYRMEVYEDALKLLPDAWVGLSPDVVDTALRGLDPHSNLLYLVLREGWIVTVLYIVAVLTLLARIDVRAAGGRMVLALCVYALVRSLFLTFDPVRLLGVIAFSGFAVAGLKGRRSAVPAAGVRRGGRRNVGRLTSGALG